MNLTEAHTILKERIGWRNDKTVEGLTLDNEVKSSVSGRFFQSEHSAITLANIRDCQPLVQISEEDFNAYLINLKSDCIWQVINDVFEKDYINDDVFAQYANGFDNIILKRMVINVSELIMTASRSNKAKRFTDDFIGKLNYDVFREAPNKFAIRGANYKHTMGISTRYDFELTSVQRRFGQTRNLLKTITKGQAHEPFNGKC